MEFYMAEMYGLTYIIAEKANTGEHWTLAIGLYRQSFFCGRPSLKSLCGMKIKYIEPKEAVEILQKYANMNPSIKERIYNVIRLYDELPF